MSERISIKEQEPEAYAAMMALENYSKNVQITPILKELIKIRASQINGCAFCIDMHTEDAVKEGESDRRIYLLSAWRESHLFSDEEKAVLQLTEEITHISSGGVSDQAYHSVLGHFQEKRTAQIIMLIVLINSWNRIAVSTRMIYKP
jgi:AhpD family alkylhydroperoxidase